MKIIEVPASRMITLPKNLFKPSDKVVLLTEGNTMIIKKLEPPQLSTIATRVPERPLSMRAIAKEVHAYRKGMGKR